MELWKTALRACESSMFSHAVSGSRAQVDFTCPGTCVQWHLPLWLTLSVACLQRGSDSPVSHRITGNRGRCGFRNSLCLPSSIIVFVLFLPISYFCSIFYSNSAHIRNPRQAILMLVFSWKFYLVSAHIFTVQSCGHSLFIGVTG